jgi:hypothetical protein
MRNFNDNKFEDENKNENLVLLKVEGKSSLGLESFSSYHKSRT